mmetsp:Transcript_1350/g.4183  ORF Transcript_1350/g.4183 Transcript_1350/m.4183 type:complete len:214 (+) Transcript_1350:325-966(+)
MPLKKGRGTLEPTSPRSSWTSLSLAPPASSLPTIHRSTRVPAPLHHAPSHGEAVFGNTRSLPHPKGQGIAPWCRETPERGPFLSPSLQHHVPLLLLEFPMCSSVHWSHLQPSFDCAHTHARTQHANTCADEHGELARHEIMREPHSRSAALYGSWKIHHRHMKLSEPPVTPARKPSHPPRAFLPCCEPSHCFGTLCRTGSGRGAGKGAAEDKE